MDNLCMGCMEELADEDVCPKCGAKKGEPQEMPFLPKKTTIGSRYIIGNSLEINGEGLSYIGYDTVKSCKVYIREFLPLNLCSRSIDLKTLAVPSYRKGLFDNELNKFLQYFRSVARLRNLPSLAAVYDIFSENNTAYVIIEWINGLKLDKFIGEKNEIFRWDNAKSMFIPLISTLSDMHGAGVLHLGISPGNMFVLPENRIMLSGFAVGDLRKINSPIEAQLYDGCSALEQYIEMYEVDESTDVYGLTATLFLSLTGEYPETATKRKKDDRLFMPKEIVRSLPENVISAIASGLRVYPNNRTLSFERLKVELLNSPVAQISLAKEQKPYKLDSKQNDKKRGKYSNFVWGMISCLIAFIVLIICFVAYWFVFKRNDYTQLQPENTSEAQTLEENMSRIEETKNKIKVPNLIGRNFSELEKQDKSQTGYDVLLLSEEFSDGIAEGCVISQTPGIGEEMYELSSIAVNVSKGSKMRKLPDIAGKSISEASLALSSIGIKPVEAWNYSDNIAEGLVIDYVNYSSENLVEYGSQITISRSLGPTKLKN